LEVSNVAVHKMIKLNRVGYKLGAVGLFGVLLSGGLAANQMISEQAINSAISARQHAADDSRSHPSGQRWVAGNGAGGARYQARKEPAGT
jgi:hypothetical protein